MAAPTTSSTAPITATARVRRRLFGNLSTPALILRQHLRIALSMHSYAPRGLRAGRRQTQSPACNLPSRSPAHAPPLSAWQGPVCTQRGSPQPPESGDRAKYNGRKMRCLPRKSTSEAPNPADVGQRSARDGMRMANRAAQTGLAMAGSSWRRISYRPFTMTLNFQNRFFRGNGSLAAKAERGLAKLSVLARIDKAQVILERRRAASPPFVARLHLAIPGPDVHASAHGFTPESALEKALKTVSEAMRGRKSKIAHRQKQSPPGFRPWNRSHQPLAAGF